MGGIPRRGPTTCLAALDAGRIPNRKGTSRCVYIDDPAPGQGWQGEGEYGLPSLASGGVSIRTRDRYFAAGSDGATKTQCH